MWRRWLERHLVDRTIVGSIPGQATRLGCGIGLWGGSGQCFSLTSMFLSLSPFPSLNMSSGEDFKKKKKERKCPRATRRRLPASLRPLLPPSHPHVTVSAVLSSTLRGTNANTCLKGTLPQRLVPETNV